MEKLTYSIPEAAETLGISKSYAYELVKQGRLPVLEIGRRKVVPKDFLEEWIQKNVKVNMD